MENEAQPFDPVIELLKARQAERQIVEAELSHHRLERQMIAVRNVDAAATGDHIAELRKAWDAVEDDARFSLRAQAHAAIRELVAEITFDSIENAATIIVGNGVRAYQVRNGALVNVFDAFAAAQVAAE